MSLQSAFGSGEAAYRRGVILGLSMAEAMLILFCCVVVLFSIKIADLNKEIARLKAELAAATELVPEQPDGAPPIPPDWPNLVLDHAQMERIRAAGLDTPLVVGSANTIKTADELTKEGYTQEEIDNFLTELPAFKKPLPKDWEALQLINEAIQAKRKEGIELGPMLSDPAVLGALGGAIVRSVTPGEVADAVNELPLPEERAAPGAPVAPANDGQWPPMIQLSEAGGYSFERGSAELTPSFVAQLHGEVLKTILERMAAYDVDVIEVTGHTDTQRYCPGGINAAGEVCPPPNLDEELPAVLHGQEAVAELAPADNAGLGLARAVAVARELMSDPRLAGVTIIPMSAAYLVGVDGKVITEQKSEDAAERRRIEIRLRRDTSGAAP